MIRRSMLSLPILLLAGALPAAGQDTVFRVAAEEVRIDVLVTEHGKPVAGLKAGDFEVFDNGVRQEIQYVTLQKQTPINATMVFDMSRSVAGQLLANLKEAAGAILSDLKKDDYAALITFNNAVTLGSSPTHDFKQIEAALEEARTFGNSSLIDGTYAGLVLAESRPEPPLLIIFSDGRDTFSWLTAEQVLDTAKRNDSVVCYAVLTDRRRENAFLSDLTRVTGGSLLEVESTKNLSMAFLGILDEFRQRYLLTYTPKGVSESSWHKVEVRVKNRSAKINARPGYTRSSSQ